MLVVLMILFVIACIFLIFIILIQPSAGEGFGAFGGIGTESFFGTKAHKQISKFTVVLAIIFLILSILINLWLSR
jgi:preprotein translocase subunit SecG